MRREQNRQNEQRQPYRSNSGQQSRYGSRDYRGGSRQSEGAESRWNDQYDRGGEFDNELNGDPERGYYSYGSDQANRDDSTDRWEFEGGAIRGGYGTNENRYQNSGREPGGYRSEWGGQSGGARYGESDFGERSFGDRSYGSRSGNYGGSTYGQSDWQQRGQQRYGSGQGWGDEAYGRQEYRHTPSSAYGGSGFGSNYGGSSYGTNFGGRGGQFYGTSDNSSPDFTSGSRYGSSYGAGMQGWGSREQGYGTGERYGSNQNHAGKGPKGYQRGDERIQEEVSEHLTQHPEIDASEIEVKVTKGEVMLIGAVQDRRTKRLVEDIAESVSGVKEVTNQLRVSQNGQSQSEQNTSVSRSQMGSHQEPSRSRTQEHELVGAGKR